MKIFKNIVVSLVVFSFVFSPYFTLAETLDTTLTPGDRSPKVSTLQRILNSIGQKVTEIGKETTYYGSLTAGAIKALQCKYNIVCSGTPETTGFGRVGPRTLALINSLKNTFGNVGRLNQVGAGAVATDGLLYSYSFDGNTADAKSGNNGTLNGSPAYATGKIGQAISLDGVDDYVSTDATKSATLNGLSAVTLSYWIKPGTLDGYPIARWGTNRQFSQTFNGSKIRMYWRVGGTGSAGTSLDHVSSKSINANEWTHVTVVYNNPTSKIYVNGVLDSSKDGVGGALNSSVADAIVFGKGTGGFFNGSVDDVNIYSRALSDSEISGIYSAGGGSPTTVTPPPASPTTVTNPTTPTSPTTTPPPTTTTSSATVGASSYYVSPSGLDTNTGTESSPLKTIQKAADLARAGTTVYVLAGNYPEHVVTKAGGTSDSARIKFKAVGKAIMQGFNIIHPYITVEGFDITGFASTYDAHIRVSGDVQKNRVDPTKPGTLISKGDNCQILNNIIHDGVQLVAGIDIVKRYGHAPNNCLIKGNRLSSLRYRFLGTAGLNHRVEENVFEWLNSRDYMLVFGGNHVFKRNIFWKGNKIESTGNHPDWIQFFNNNGEESYGHLFEENYIEGLEEGVQLGQINSGGGLDNPFYNPDTRDITFRRNVIANVGNNFNISVPGMTFDHNTFYRLAFSQTGIGFGGNLTRGESSRALITNNVFVGGGIQTRNDVGFYAFGDAVFTPEAIIAHVIKDKSDAGYALAAAIHTDLKNRGYINSNGIVEPAGKAITDISQFIISDAYAVHKPLLYQNFVKIKELDAKLKSTSRADYNFVANTAAMGYSAKPSTPSKCAKGIFSDFAFCEVHGKNGGDPKFRSITDLLGPDGKIFTLDDGLKPRDATSPLCGMGVEGTDVGAYSCDPNKVFAVGDSGSVGTDPGTYDPTVDTTLPVVSITSPTAGQNLSGSVTLNANATDALGVAGVQFQVDGVNAGSEDRVTPFSITWNSATVANGSHTITAIARDTSGNRATSAGVSFTTNNAVVTPTARFTTGDRVKANADAVNVRPTPSLDNLPLGKQNTGALGTVRNGPTTASGYTWWDINFDAGSDGWVAETYIDKAIDVELPPTSVSCTPTNIRCVDDTPGSTQEYATVQACANVAVAGDTCLVHPGNYPEFIQTVNSGTASNKITFKANGLAIIEGIRIKNQHITIEGFDMTKYGSGLSPAHVSVEPTGSFCTVKNNKIRDGIYLSSRNYYFDAATKTIRNPAGGFLAAGFEAGAQIYLASDINNWIKNHDKVKTIKSVTDTVITLVDTDTLITEGPVFSLIYVTRIDKSGVKGIDFNLTSSAGSANNCVISGNLFSNIVGAAVNISGSNHLFERNIIERMSGWWIFTFGGDNNVFRYNHIRNSPRYEGFGAPGDGAVHSDGPGSWDFYSSIFRSFGSPSISSVNNVFEYNIVENVDNQFMTIGAYAPGLSTAPKTSSKTIFRNNVFSGIEGQGAIHRPETVFQNNTFYNAAFDATGGPVIIVSGTSEGSADGSVIKANAFVGNSTADPTRTTGGYYYVQNAVMAEAPNYNFVAGPASKGFPSKSDFAGKETNGINGGNPMFRNISNPAGPDGILFTADDGFKPLAGSPLCTGGAGGGHIGAYSCDGSLPPTSSDTTAPAISITSPANNSTISGSTNLTVSATDNIGVVGVRYLVDGTQIGSEVTSSPFSATWSGMSDGTYTLTAEARDAAGNKKLSSSISVTVKTATVNVAPVLNTIGNKSVAENSTLTFQLSATDGNGDTLTYSASTLPSGATLTGNSFSWKPSFTQSGSYSPSFTVSDGKGLTDSETITITVSNLNQSPTANAGIDQSITLPSSAVLSASASTDPDGQSLTYSWSKVTGPGNVNFSSNTNIAPTATFSIAGTYTLRVTVSDGTLSSNDTVTITVLSNPSADDDADGVLDGVDLCPNSRVGVTVNTKGCPVPKMTKFTTKPVVTNEDLRSMDSIELGNSYGKVSWKKTGTPYSLVKVANSSYDSLDLDTHLNIKAGEISLDSASVPELNRPATLTFFNVTIRNPEILKNGVICSECDLSYSGTTLTFTVPGFSTYTIVSNDDPSVSITDPSSGTEVSGNTMIKATASDDLGIESVSFYANDELIGTDTSAPYEVSWSPSSGNYTLTAKAKDIGGLEKTSSSVSVTGKKKTGSGSASGRNKGVITSNVTANTPSTLTLPTNATREQTIQYLIAKIQELLTLYNQIKAQEGGSTTTTTTDTVLKGFQFTKTFGIGTNSSEVRYLQRFLNTHGFPVGTGLGSYGKEVDTFGPVTKATLIKYQLANGIEGTGYFGNQTRAKINQVLLSE